MFSVIGKKIGMSRFYNERGEATPVTLVKLYDCCVIDFKTNENKDYNKVTLAFEKTNNPEKKISKPLREFYNKKNLEPYKNKKEFKVAKNLEFKAGDIVGIDWLAVGDVVDVIGITKGKSFAGGMKRWNFKGLRASHGVSISHRSHGSTGQRQDPGRVWKNMKMAGHLGCEQVTIKNLSVVDLDKEDNVICIKGAIPGHNNSNVFVSVKVSNKPKVKEDTEKKENSENK